MASSYTPLGVQLMVTGEKAGLWGGYTNTNLEILEQIAGGYTTQAVADGTTTALAVDDGNTGATIATSTIKMTGALTGASGLSVPDDITGMKYLVLNATTGSQDVTFKTAGGTGVTWSSTDARLLWHDGTNIVDSGFGSVTASSTTTFTNKTLTAPKFASGGFIADAGGDENLVFTEVGTPVNELRITNAATGNGPILAAISTSTTDSNIDLNINPLGTGILKSGTAAVKVAGLETIFVPAQGMFGTTTNGADAQVIETTATRPEMKVLDFDPSTIEYAQFSVAMPKSWNADTITFQAFWSPSTTNTGAAMIGLQGISVANDATSDIAFPTAIDVTDSGTAALEDVLVSPVSAAVTVTSAAADTYTYFQVARNATNVGDTFTGDVRLLGIKIFYTTDAANDA